MRITRLLFRLSGASIACLALAGTATGHQFFIVPERFRVLSIERVAAGIQTRDGLKNESVSLTFRPETITIGFHHEGGRNEGPAHGAGKFPQSELRVRAVRDAVLISERQTVRITKFDSESKRMATRVRITEPGHYVLGAVYESFSSSSSTRRRAMEASEFNDYLRAEGLTDILEMRAARGEMQAEGSERWTKFAKSILLAGSPDRGFRKVIGYPLEIVPEADPYAIEPGGVLPVRVLLNGVPVGGQELKATWTTPRGPRLETVGRTDSEGKISVPMTFPGPWRLHTIYMERSTDTAAADWQSFWATLTFEVPGGNR